MSNQPKYTPIPSVTIRDNSITDAVFRTYTNLRSLAWRHDWKFTDWLTVPYLCQYLGMDRATILRHIGQLKGHKLLDWKTDGKNRYRFSILEVRLPEVAKSPLCDPSSSGVNTDTLTDIEPPLPPAKSQGCDLVLIHDQDAWNALRAAHICEPATTELANLPHVTAAYVRAMAIGAKRDGVKIGALIHRIREGWPAPAICDQCGGLDGDHTRDCPTRPARPAGDLTAADRMRIERPQPEPESPVTAIWHEVLSTLRLQVSESVFSAYLEHTAVLSYENGTFCIATDNERTQSWLNSRMRSMIERELSRVAAYESHVTFVLNEEQHESITSDRNQ